MIWIYLLALVISAGGTGMWLRFAGAKRFVDIPGPRSSHQRPTVRGGGVVFISTFVVCAALGLWSVDFALSRWLLLPVLALMLVGLIDDLKSLSALARLLTQLLLTTAIVVFANSALMLPWWVQVLMVLGATWLINLYNFMDGIDGIAAIEALTVSGAMALLSLWQQQMELAQLAGLLTVCVAGFFVWNFPTARIFMGDAGSGALGISFVLFIALTASLSPMLAWCWILLLAVFIVDASWTLTVRLVTGQKIWTAHKLHAYQILSRRLRSHAKVSLCVGLYNMLWLLPLAYLALSMQVAIGWLLLAAFAPVAALCLLLKAGQLPAETASVRASDASSQ